MKHFFFLCCLLLFTVTSCNAQIQKDNYTYKDGDYSGIGKWYLDREIAHVMGFQGIEWLERSDREAEESTSRLIKNMKIKSGDEIADVGAGSGYHVFRIAPLVSEGTVYAVDIQDEMLDAMMTRAGKLNVKNVEILKGGRKKINLPENSLDKVLLVDVYHEFDFPVEMIASIKKALRPDGELFLIEYRAEDKTVPIKELHKMSEEQAVKEMEAAGLKLTKNIGNLPWQHCMVFVKK